MSNTLKIPLLAFLITAVGVIAAHNARWIRDGSSPWWTVYFISVMTSSLYGYLAKNPLFPLTYTSAFQTFFFHSSWYLTTIFILGEGVNRFQGIGIFMILAGMVMMSLK